MLDTGRSVVAHPRLAAALVVCAAVVVNCPAALAQSAAVVAPTPVVLPTPSTQPLLACGQPVVGHLGANTVQLYRLDQPKDQVLVDAVDTSGIIGLLHLQAKLANGTTQDTCSGVLSLTHPTGVLAVSDCVPNLTADQMGQYTVNLNVVSDTPGNCGKPLPCGGTIVGALKVPGEVNAYTFPAHLPGEVVTLRILSTVLTRSALRLRVFGPDGVPVDGGNTCDGGLTLTLPHRGTYTVLVSACARALIGAYAISFEPPVCPVIVKVGDALGAADRTVGFRVILHTLGQTVAATQNDIAFDPHAPIVATASGDPACRVNPDINKNDSAFAFQPPGCQPGVDCTSVRALVFAIGNLDPIPDGSELYGCAVHIAPTGAAGDSYPLVCSNGGASTSSSQPIPVICRDGSVAVHPVCIGDCTEDGRVTVSDLVKGVGIALGLLPLDQCPTLDRNLDGRVTIDELVQAINNALTACVAVALG